MERTRPIYTEKARCQDCYKCLRNCPVKAIRVEHESATVMADRCIYCGVCVASCPVGAKKVRDDMGRLKLLLRSRPRVWASLAPSWVAEFKGLDAGRMVAALRALGFTGVSETALGAQEVSAACAAMLSVGEPRLHLSTACPAVVELIQRYRPQHAAHLTPLLSPAGAHAKLLRRAFGEHIGVVFIGPCIAKKHESDLHPGLMDLAITFEGLRETFERAGIDPYAMVPGSGDRLEPETGEDGSLYAMDGGMLHGVNARLGAAGVRMMSFSGVKAVFDGVDGLEDRPLDAPLFLELLACEGGCINGPRMTRHCGTALKRLDILDRAGDARAANAEVPEDLRLDFPPAPVPEHGHPETDIQAALRLVGKHTLEDEVNCGACGYDSCRGLAAAMLEGRAEVAMCVSYMRKIAMNKANALLRSMPAGVVIVDETLHIAECNRKFAEMLGEETLMVYDAEPGLPQADLGKVAPFAVNLFAQMMAENASELRRDCRVGSRIFQLLLFPVEQGRLAGGILQDITEPAFQRDEVIQKAQEVIRKNVTTVQQIAYLLGENAADTEMLLHSIVDTIHLGPPDNGQGAR
ncbi:MAG TPA: [Fe-Fe] hydrogenase large subunit C-terminal domain-containing protein [Holophaga sp.]|nr:[Fe-Fe] hydrogenase large subunit C-terminal domain-containing protein [Holophaga sp.]